MRQAPRKRSGPGACFMGHYSTIVLILQEGVAPPGRRVLLWPTPSFGGGSGLACAASPPTPPSDVFRDRATRCPPSGGCAPCTLLEERRRRRFLTWRVGMLPNQGKGKDPLPNLPPSTGAGTVFDCMCNISQPDFGVCRHGAITKALQAVTRALQTVTKLLRVVTEPLQGGMAPKSPSHNGIRSGPTLPRRVVGLGEHPSPPPPATGGFSAVSPQYIRYAAGSKEEKQAGGLLHGGTIAQSFGFCNRGSAPNLDGWSCSGLRRCTPGGGRAPCTLLGDGGGAVFYLGAFGKLPCQVKEKDPLPSFPLKTRAGMGGFAGGWPSTGPNSPLFAAPLSRRSSP